MAMKRCKGSSVSDAAKGKKKLKQDFPIVVKMAAGKSEGGQEGEEPEVEEQEQNIRAILQEGELSSTVKARLLLQYIIAPMDVETFYSNYWEKKPLVIKRNNPTYYDGWFSTAEMQRIFREHSLEYGADVDVTRFKDGIRTTLNPENSSVNSSDIWKFYEDGCSLRLLCPQQFSDDIWLLLSVLEEEFGCMAGSNTYLTPKGTQGFAPHYDDIEAFLLQMEGKKYWKVYAPKEEDLESQLLPRISSRNFKPEEVSETPIYEGWIEQGDLLYFPRGFIHQGNCSPDTHSLHVTVSTAQNNTWADFLELLVPEALQVAAQNSVALRRSLPRDFFQHLGAVHSDREDEQRGKCVNQAKEALKTVLSTALTMLDGAADQRACKHLVDRLPPVLSEKDEECSVEASPLPRITEDTSVRLIRQGAARMTVEDGKAVFYHLMDNSRKHHENPLRPLEFELDDAPSIEALLTSYPNYTRVGDLPLEDKEDKIELVKALYNEGCLVFEEDN